MTTQIQPNVYHASQQKSWLYHQMEHKEPKTTKVSGSNKVTINSLSNQSIINKGK